MRIDKYKINEILSIRDLEKETIFAVIGRMEALMGVFQSNRKFAGFIPFLQVYLMVTKNVYYKHLVSNEFYENYKKIERLDVYFANLYFKPLKKFLLSGIKVEPWKNYFDVCSKNNTSAVCQLMLGINAHINSDLCHVLVDLKYGCVNDFDKVNLILQELIPDVMKFLAFHEKDLIGFGGVFFKELFRKEFCNVIVKWRFLAWDNAILARKEGKKTKLLKSIDKYTEKISHEIVDVFNTVFNPVKAVNAIKKLNALEINLTKNQ